MFLDWLFSKDTQKDMTGEGRNFRRKTAKFWDIWAMPPKIDKVVTDTVSEVDAAMLVVEPIANIGPAEENLISQIKQHHMPSILVINKIDTVKKEDLLAVIATYAQAHEFDAVIPISARTGEGVEEYFEGRR